MKKWRRLVITVLVCVFTLGLSLGFRQSEAQAAALKTPTLKSAVASGTNTVTIRWNKVAGVDGYRLYRRLPGQNWKGVKVIKGSNVISYKDTTLLPGKKYIYTVRAYKKKLLSGYNKTGASAVTGLAMPTLTSAKALSYDSIKVGWKKVPGAQGYQVYRKQTAGWTLVKTVGANTTSYTDNGLSPQTQYTYTVRAYCKYDSKVFRSEYNSYGVKTVTKNVEIDPNQVISSELIQPTKTQQLVLKIKNDSDCAFSNLSGVINIFGKDGKIVYKDSFQINYLHPRREYLQSYSNMYLPKEYSTFSVVFDNYTIVNPIDFDIINVKNINLQSYSSNWHSIEYVLENTTDNVVWTRFMLIMYNNGVVTQILPWSETLNVYATIKSYKNILNLEFDNVELFINEVVIK